MLRTLLGLLITLMAWSAAPAAVQPHLVQPEELDQGFVIVVDDVARMASADRPMYLASNFGGWDPAKPEYVMTQRSDGRWQIAFEKPKRTGTLQFKFTLGSWDYVETDPDGNDIDNRTLAKVDASALGPGEKPVIELRVPRFRNPADIAQGRQNTVYRDWNVTGQLRRVQVSGGAGEAAGLMRDLLIWLPPGYDEPENADRRYPVLYLFDGQNLFEKVGAIPDEWHADETAQRLIESGEIEPFVIVGVPNAGEARIQEYLPFEAGLHVSPAGAAFAEWFMNAVVPRVERAIRVTDDASRTGIGGSSLGATISLSIAMKYPDRFGLLLLESMPPLGPEPSTLSRPVEASWPTRAFVGVGGKEMGDAPAVAGRNQRIEQRSRELAEMLEAWAGSENIRLEIAPEAEHDERAWSERFPSALRFLFARDGDRHR